MNLKGQNIKIVLSLCNPLTFIKDRYSWVCLDFLLPFSILLIQLILFSVNYKHMLHNVLYQYRKIISNLKEKQNQLFDNGFESCLMKFILEMKVIFSAFH